MPNITIHAMRKKNTFRSIRTAVQRTYLLLFCQIPKVHSHASTIKRPARQIVPNIVIITIFVDDGLSLRVDLFGGLQGGEGGDTDTTQ